MADIASVALKYTADTSGYIASLRGAASANRDFGASLDTSTKADRFRVPDMSAMTEPLNETVRLLREIATIQMKGLSVEEQIAIQRQLQAEETNRMITAQSAARNTMGSVEVGGTGEVGQINAETSAFARQLEMRKEAAALRVAQNMAATRSAEIVREESRASEELAQDLARVNAAKIAAINAKTVNVSESSRFDNANPFAQQVMATQKLNALLAQRKTLTDDLARAENRLAITQQVAEVRSIRANLTADSTINRFRNLGNTAEDSQRKYANFGVVMQQAGYQMQDFAVQVAGGQNALVALSQQGSQMLGVFGVGGAIAGAALAVGILGYRLFSSSEAAKKLNETVLTLGKDLSSINKQSYEFSIAKSPLTNQLEYFNRAKEAAEKTAKINKTEAEFAKKRAENAGGFFDEISRTTKELESQGGMLANLWATHTIAAVWKYASGTNEAAVAMNALADAGKKEVIARQESLRAAQLEEQILMRQRSLRDSVLNELDPSRISDAEESRKREIDDLIKIGGLTKEQGRTILAMENQRKIQALNAPRIADDKAAVDRTKAYDAQIEANEDLYRSDKERLSIMDKQLEAMAGMGEVGTLAFAQLQGKADALAKSIKERARQTIISLQARMPEALKLNAGNGFAYGQSVSGRGADILDLTRNMLNALEKLVELERYDQNPI